MLKETGNRQRESVPFTVRTADGDYHRADVLVAAGGREARRGGGARVATVVRARQAAAQLHAPRDRLLRRGRADLGATLGRGGHRDAARGACLAPDRERDPTGVRARSGSTTTRAPPAMPTSAGCRRSSTSTTTCSPTTACASTTSSRRCPRSARTATSRTSSRSPAAGLVVRGGVDPAPLRARLVAARPRGDLGEGARRAAGADLPHDPRTRASASPAPAAGSTRRRSSSTSRVVANEEGLRQLEFVLETLGDRAGRRATAPAGTTRPARATIGTSHMDMVCLVRRRARDRAPRAAPRQLRLRALS